MNEFGKHMKNTKMRSIQTNQTTETCKKLQHNDKYNNENKRTNLKQRTTLKKHERNSKTMKGTATLTTNS